MGQNIRQVGLQSVLIDTPVFIRASASIVGKKEGEGPLGEFFDKTGTDDLFGAKTWEDAESSLQKEAVTLAMEKAGLSAKEIRYLLAGDLLGQSIATSFGLMQFDIPLFGLYGACSTCGESLSLGSMLLAGGFADHVVCVTSSHFASAEKEFRFPLGYGSQRPMAASWTVTGSGAFVLSTDSGKRNAPRITGITTGKIVDYGIKDTFNMGCAMAPAAADLIRQHLQDFNREATDYDKIITGDLGTVGKTALMDLLKEYQIDIAPVHMDCGIEMYDSEKQGTDAGGSGCGCCAATLSAYILKKLEKGDWKRVLFIPTGALLSKTSFNEGKAVPGIAHGVVIEA